MIVNVEQSAALPVGTVVRSASGTIAAKRSDTTGVCFGVPAEFDWSYLALPLLVLWYPPTFGSVQVALPIVSEEWCAFYGGTDPESAAGLDWFGGDDAEVCAREQAQWLIEGGVARRAVVHGEWEVMPLEDLD